MEMLQWLVNIERNDSDELRMFNYVQFLLQEKWKCSKTWSWSRVKESDSQSY